MKKGLIFADDLTGALDTGVELASSGYNTVVQSNGDTDMSVIDDDSIQVVVINTASRHLQPKAAYRIIYTLCEKAKQLGFTQIYKKTDSALRGNVGAELSALLDCMKAPILFVPAFPDMGRVLRKGALFIEGVPVDQSDFGKDPFTPVRFSHIDEILHASAESLSLCLHESDHVLSKPSANVHAINASTREELTLIATNAKQSGITLFAGCAGFAGHLPFIWELSASEIQIPVLPRRMLIFSGSLNRITVQQLHRGREMGYYTHTVQRDELDDPETFPYDDVLYALDKGHVAIVESFSSLKPSMQPALEHAEVRDRMDAARSLGMIASKLIKAAKDCMPLIIGGDTLLSVMLELQCRRLYPLKLIATGTVLAIADTCLGHIPIATKSGGLGPLHVIERALDYLHANKGGTRNAH